MNDHEMLRRLRAADPARDSSPAESWISDLLEATMSTSLEQQTHSRRWVPAVAAAAVAVAGAATYFVVGQADDGFTGEPTSMTLTMPDIGTSMSSCMPFSVDVLQDMPVAFSGTATEVMDDSVTLDVDVWYQGGNADTVVLEQYDAETASLDGIVFTTGDRYLVTATEGTVNLCGYSVAWSQDMAEGFEEAFAS